MKILVIGGGGREHALVWKLSQSPQGSQLFCAPGNPGIAELAECVPLAANAIAELAEFAESQQMDLTVVGSLSCSSLVFTLLSLSKPRRMFCPGR